MVQSNVSDELASHSVPYSSIPESSPSDMPQTDHFKFSTPDTTIDEHILAQPGHPAPAPSGNTTGPLKTTIRLVSASNSNSNLTQSPEVGTPQLRPVDPPFDLLMGSPDARGQSRVPVWPLSPQGRLYPTLPAHELDEAKRHQERSKLPGNSAPFQPSIGSTKVYPKPSNDVQDLFSPAPKPPGQQKERVGIPRSEPFLFGSPLPRHSVSNKAFDTAAASVLDEMNKRLSAAGVQKVGVDVFGTVPAVTKRDSGSLRASGTADRFDKIHEEQFNKMDSIADHYAAKRGSKKRKSDVLGHGSAPAKKRSIAPPHRRMGIPGGFGDEDDAVDDVQEEGDRRMSKRVRVLEEDGGKDKGRRLTISPKKSGADEKQAERERAATRKMLEVRKGKRRSSRHVGPQAVSSTSPFSLFSRPWQFSFTNEVTRVQTRAKRRLVLEFCPQPSQSCAACGISAWVLPRKPRTRQRRHQRPNPKLFLWQSQRKQSLLHHLRRSLLSQRRGDLRKHLWATGRVSPPFAQVLLRQAGHWQTE